MSYDASQLSTSSLYRVRFTLQDTDVTNEFLSDDEINYLIGVSTTESAAILTAAKRMLGQFSQYTRERENSIEVYGNEIFKQWKQYLSELVQELTSGSTLSYMVLGGTVKSEVDRVKNDGESVGNGYELDYIANKRTWTSANGSDSLLDHPFRLK